MNTTRIPLDELMSYTLGQLNTILKQVDASDKTTSTKPYAQVVHSSMQKMQSEYLASLSENALKKLKEKHGIR